jgi:hypothetical protein
MFRIERRFFWAIFGVLPVAGPATGRFKNGRELGLSMMPHYSMCNAQGRDPNPV